MSSSRQAGEQNSQSKPQTHDPTHFQTRLTSDFNGARHYGLTHTPTFSGTIGSESDPEPQSTTSQLIHLQSQPKTIFTTTTQSAMSTNTHSAGPLIIDQSSPSSSLISPRAGPSGLPSRSLVPPLPQYTSDPLLTTSASHGSPTVPDPPSPVRNSPPLGIITEVLLPPVVLDPLLKEKMNYRCTYDPALDSSVVKKSAGPLYRHFKPSGTIISRPAKDPRLRMAYPSPLSGVPKTASQKSSLVAGLSRSSKGRQTFHSQVERLEPYAFDKNSVGPPPPPPPCAVLITGLSNLVTGEQVRSHFVKFGRVAECEIKLDPQTGGSLGICWVRFVNDVVNSDKDSSGKNRTPPVKSSRGLQDGHQCAVEATQKANGARIGIMLTTGPSQSSSMLRRPQKSQSNWGIKCELDGSGSKCAKAVAHALRKLYPPPPSRPIIPHDSVGHSSSVDQAPLPLKQHTSTLLAESHPRSIPPAMSIPSRLETQPPALVGRSPLPTTKALEGPKLSSVTSSNTNTPAHQGTPSVPFANHSPMYGSSAPLNHDHSNLALAPVADVLSASQGHREQQNHGSKFVPSGSAPTMPSALRHQAALVQPRGRPPLTEPYTRPFASCSHPYMPSSSAPCNSSLPLPPPIKYRPDETPSVSRMPMVLKTSHYTIPGRVNAGPVRGKIAAGFVAAAQNAAIIAAKKAGIRLPSEVESNDAPIATTSSRVHHSAYSGECDLHSRLEASTSMHLPKETPQDLDEEDDSSESEDEDAQAERLKEAEREALIASRKVRSSRVAMIPMEKHSQITLQPNLHQPHSMNSNTSLIKPQQPPSDLMKLSILWSHNCIGVNKSIKLEILKRLSINGHPFVTIDRIELGKVDNRARIPQGPLELKQYLVNFEPHQVMTDGQMWYITFEKSNLAHDAVEFMKEASYMGTKLPCVAHALISNDDYQFLVENNLQILPPRHQQMPPVKRSKPTRAPSKSSLPLTDEELIQRATTLILDELRATFLRDLKNRIVSGKVWELLKEDQMKQSSKASQTAPVSTGATAQASTSQRTDDVFSLDTQRTVKLPSFAKRKSVVRRPSATDLSRRESVTPAPNFPLKPNGHPIAHSHESASGTPRPFLSRRAEDDSTSIASSDLPPPSRRRLDSREGFREDEGKTAVSDDEDRQSIYSFASIPAILPAGKAVKKKVRKRFKKIVTFTSSEEEVDDEIGSQPDWKRSKYGHQSPEVVLESTQKPITDQALDSELELKGKSKLYESETGNTPAIDDIIVDSPRADTPTLAPTTAQTSPLSSLTHPDEEDLDPRPKKKQKRGPPTRTKSSEDTRHHQTKGPPNAYEHEVAEDEEDLFYVKLVLERLRAGQSPHPPRPPASTAPPDLSGSPNKVGSTDPAARAALKPVEMNEQDRKKDSRAEEPLPPHSTGSSRTQGYYQISSSQKAFYLPQRNKAIIDVGPITNNTTNNTSMALAVSRSTRVNSRRFVINMEQNKKGSVDVVADVLKFNQLRTRKKQLKFARSPIHDWGLYAMETIPAGEMVIEYVGEVIRQAVADRREKAYERMGIGSSYLFRVDDDLVVDATKKGNLGRLINHCCAPNCTAKIITINGEKKIVIYAKATIELGDEVTYDYHFPKEDVKIPCLCGSPKCKGTLN